MNKIKLGDILELQPKSKVKAGDGISNGKYPFYTCSNELTKSLNNADYEGDALIFGTGGMASIHYEKGKFSTSTDCLVYKSNKNINLSLINKYLRTNIHLLENGFKGAGLRHISRDYISNISIPLPERILQDKIVKELDLIEKTITNHSDVLKKYDTLIKSRFIEMFGDPVSNPMGWEVYTVEECATKEPNSLKAGPFGSSLKKEFYVETGYKIYGQEQVISGDANFGDYYIDEKKFNELKSCEVKANDVLISLVGTYGKLLIIPQEFQKGIINPRLLKITFDKSKIDTVFFKYFFASDSLQKKLTDNTHGGTMGILNLGIVRKIKIPVPPSSLQNDFAAFVQQIDKSKFEIANSLKRLYNKGMLS